MKLGILWFDDRKAAALEDKVRRAADHFESKYARRPDICYVHPLTKGTVEVVDEIAVMASNTVLPNHLWIGTKE